MGGFALAYLECVLAAQYSRVEDQFPPRGDVDTLQPPAEVTALVQPACQLGGALRQLDRRSEAPAQQPAVRLIEQRDALAARVGALAVDDQPLLAETVGEVVVEGPATL